jgi:photosystem II stability/assembly factor-like uncharacterized protein
MKIKLFAILSCIVWSSFVTHAQNSVPLFHPKDQIALQLGAIQMGYTVPFSLSLSNPLNAQQATNALAMGRNALDATVSKLAARVQGVVSSPSVDTVEYRDQLYQAVEAVVTSPAVGSLKGFAILEGGKKQIVSAKFLPPSSIYTIPVPYAVEANSSVTSLDAQGILNGENQLPANSIGSTQISQGSIQPIHLLPGTLSPLKVVTGNISAEENQSYLLQPGMSGAITLPGSPAIGDVVKIQGDGLKAKAGTDQAINQWTSRKIADATSISRVRCSADGKTIFVLAEEGGAFYKSTDAAKTWQLLSGASEDDRAMDIQCSDDGNTVLLTSESSGYKLSRNGGVSWTDIILADFNNSNISKILIAPVGNKLFGLADDEATLFFSSNEGATWQSKTFPEQRGVSDLLFSGDGLTMLYVTEDNNGAIKCQISYDGGASWNAKDANHGFSISENNGLQGLISRDGSKIIFFVTSSGENGNFNTHRYLSLDCGDSWTSNKCDLYMDLENLEENKPEPLGFEDGNTILFGNKISRDQGKTWVGLPVKITNNDEEPNYILTKAYSHDFMRRIGIGLVWSDDDVTEVEQLFTSWADEVVSERGNSLQLVYLGNGIWSSLESLQTE